MFKIDTSALHPSQREPLFEIDGTTYTVPKSVGGEVALKALRLFAEQGEEIATLFCIEQTIGKDAYAALCGVENLPPKVLRGIIAVCREKVLGDVDEEGKD